MDMPQEINNHVVKALSTIKRSLAMALQRRIRSFAVLWSLSGTGAVEDAGHAKTQ